MLIAIEGTNGTGKTFLFSHFQKRYGSLNGHIGYVKFPVRRNIVERTKKGDERLQAFKEDMLYWYEAEYNKFPIWIADRSILSTLVYQTRDSVEIRGQIPSVLDGIPTAIIPEYILLLEAAPETIKSRLATRDYKTIDEYDAYDPISTMAMYRLGVQLLSPRAKYRVLSTDNEGFLELAMYTIALWIDQKERTYA